MNFKNQKYQIFRKRMILDIQWEEPWVVYSGFIYLIWKIWHICSNPMCNAQDLKTLSMHKTERLHYSSQNSNETLIEHTWTLNTEEEEKRMEIGRVYLIILIHPYTKQLKEVSKFFCQEVGSKYFRPCQPQSFCCVVQKQWHVNKWV